MPHYVFLCKDCGKEFEIVLHIEDLAKVPVQCPNCQSVKTEQAVATFSAITSKKS